MRTRAEVGFTAITGDCNDDSADISLDASETQDEIDNDGDGDVDEEPVDGTTYYTDMDGDGYGDSDAEVVQREPDTYATERPATATTTTQRQPRRYDGVTVSTTTAMVIDDSPSTAPTIMPTSMAMGRDAPTSWPP